MVVISSGRGPGSWPRQTPPADTLIETADTPKMVSRATLICRPNSHPFSERTLALEKPEKIGRSVARVRAAANNAIFDCKVLSRNHALLWFEDGKFFLQDTKSSNGTFVNSQRLGKGSEESPPRELCSGDIVQFGVDVMENSKKVTHGCIVATLKLYLPDGKEAIASTATMSIGPSCPVQSPELYQLQQFVQEAVHREQSVDSKLAKLQRLMDGVRTATDSSWKALVDEDRLLTRLEMLEGQHALYSKNFGEDKLREELGRLQEDKNTYQSVAKESLKKVLQEKLEAVRRLQEVERSLSSAEKECRHQMELRESAVDQLEDVAVKYEAKLQEAVDLETKVKELEANIKEREEQSTAAEERWKQERSQLKADEVQQRARLEGLQAETDFTKEKLASLRQRLNSKLSEPTPNCEVGGECAGMRQTEQQLETVRTQLTAAETQLNEALGAVDQLKGDIEKSEQQIAEFKKKTSALEGDLIEVKAAAEEKRDQVTKLEQEMTEKEAELQKLLKQQSSGDADINEETDAEQLRSKVNALNELLTETRQQRADAESRVDRLEFSLLVTRNYAQEETLRADDLRSQLKESEGSLAVRWERRDQLQQQVLQLVASVTEAVGQLQLLQQRHDSKQQALEHRLASVDKLQESLSAAESRLTESSREGEGLRRQLDALRAETESARKDTSQRQKEVEAARSRLSELEQRLKACTAERDAAVSERQQRQAASLQTSPVPSVTTVSNTTTTTTTGGGGEKPDADDAEKAELRRQLRYMDDQLKELSLQSRTMDTSHMVALAVLALALFVMLLVANS